MRGGPCARLATCDRGWRRGCRDDGLRPSIRQPAGRPGTTGPAGASPGGRRRDPITRIAAECGRRPAVSCRRCMGKGSIRSRHPGHPLNDDTAPVTVLVRTKAGTDQAQRAALSPVNAAAVRVPGYASRAARFLRCSPVMSNTRRYCDGGPAALGHDQPEAGAGTQHARADRLFAC
jgi:hypothetical protein